MNFEALNKISYGLYLITTHYEGQNYGFIGNAICDKEKSVFHKK